MSSSELLSLGDDEQSWTQVQSKRTLQKLKIAQKLVRSAAGKNVRKSSKLGKSTERPTGKKSKTTIKETSNSTLIDEPTFLTTKPTALSAEHTAPTRPSTATQSNAHSWAEKSDSRVTAQKTPNWANSSTAKDEQRPVKNGLTTPNNTAEKSTISELEDMGLWSQETLVDMISRAPETSKEIEPLFDSITSLLGETYQLAESMNDFTMADSMTALLSEQKDKFEMLAHVLRTVATETLRSILDSASLSTPSPSAERMQVTSTFDVPALQTQPATHTGTPLTKLSKEASNASIFSDCSSFSWSDVLKGHTTRALNIRESNKNVKDVRIISLTADALKKEQDDLDKNEDKLKAPQHNASDKPPTIPQRPSSIPRVLNPNELRRKHVKAQELRESILINRTQKAKLKLDRVVEVITKKDEKAQQRLQELEEERLRKQAEMAALQEAAIQRRKMHEQERLLKLQREHERKNEINARKEMEKLNLLAQKQAQYEEKARRVKEFQMQKQEQMRKVIEKKMERAIERHGERIEQVKVKAAAINEKAGEVAARVLSHRNKSPEGKHAVLLSSVTPPSAINFSVDTETETAPVTSKKNKKSKKNTNKSSSHIPGPVNDTVAAPKSPAHKVVPPPPTSSPAEGQESVWKRSVDEEKPVQPSARSKGVAKRAKALRDALRGLTESDIVASIHKNALSTNTAPKTALDIILDHLSAQLTRLRTEKSSFSAWAALERTVNDCVQHVSQVKLADDYEKLCKSGVFSSVVKAASMMDGFSRPLMPPRIMNLAMQVLRAPLINENNRKLILSSPEMPSIELAELLAKCLQFCYTEGKDSLLATSALFSILQSLISGTPLTHSTKKDDNEADMSEENDAIALTQIRKNLIAYLGTIEIMERLKTILLVAHGPIDSQSQHALVTFLKQSTEFLETLTFEANPSSVTLPVFEKRNQTCTNVIHAIESAELVGLVTMLDALVLYRGNTARSASTEELPKEVLEISYRALRTLNNVARLSLPSFQKLLSGDVARTEFFHLLVFWLSYCSEFSHTNALSDPYLHPSPSTDVLSFSASQLTTEILNEVILMAGYFSLQNDSNRALLRWGQAPGILHTMVNLPFKYFTDIQLMEVLFPAMVIACYQDDDNLLVIEEEMSSDMLVDYLKEKISKEKETGTSEDKGSDTVRFDLKSRFPRELWDEAIEYFCR